MTIRILGKGTIEIAGHGVYQTITVPESKYTTSKTEIRIAKILLLSGYLKNMARKLADIDETSNTALDRHLESLAELNYEMNWADILEKYSRYKLEFEAEKFKVPEIVLRGDWEDMSWHNDICPTFINRRLKLCLWVDYVDPNDREYYNERDMYTISDITLGDEGEYDHGDDLYETNSVEELTDYINSCEKEYNDA